MTVPGIERAAPSGIGSGSERDTDRTACIYHEKWAATTAMTGDSLQKTPPVYRS